MIVRQGSTSSSSPSASSGGRCRKLLLLLLQSSWAVEAAFLVQSSRHYHRSIHFKTIALTARPMMQWHHKNDDDGDDIQPLPQRHDDHHHRQEDPPSHCAGGSTNGFRNSGYSKIWRKVMVSILISWTVATATFGRRSYCDAAVTAAMTDVSHSVVVTEPDVLGYHPVALSTTAKPVATTMQRASSKRYQHVSSVLQKIVLVVAVGAGTWLGLKRSPSNHDASVVETSSTTVSDDEEKDDDPINDRMTTATASTSGEEIQEDEEVNQSKRILAQKFVETALARIKEAKDKAFRSSTSSSSSSSATSSTISPTGIPSYIDSISSSSPASWSTIKTSATAKSATTPSSYLDTLTTDNAFTSLNDETSERANDNGLHAVNTSRMTSTKSFLPKASSSSFRLGGGSSSNSRKWAKARQQPKPASEEDALARKYAALTVPDRAYQILVDLGMVESSNHLGNSNEE